MALRDTILVTALIAGVAIIVMMYVRRGLSDIQGQIDDIETVLASMPPELTSGQLTSLPPGWNQPAVAAPAPVAQPVSSEPESHPSMPVLQEGGEWALATAAWTPDEELEEPIIEASNDMPEYSLDDEFGIATLSEPGVYESGVVQLTVLPAGSELSADDVEMVEFDADPSTPLAPESSPEMDLGDVEVVRDDDDDDRAASPEPPESPPVGDEFDHLTLPELKARLKATQPDMRGIARMKRAEVLDRLRSVPEEAAN